MWTVFSYIYIKFSKNIDVCETLMPPFPNMTFDLDLWPTDLKINRDHLLIMDYLPTKFEASGTKPSWVISCTRLRETDIPTDGPTDRPTDRHVQRNMPLLFQRGGGHKKLKKYTWSRFYEWNFEIHKFLEFLTINKLEIVGRYLLLVL